MSPSFKHVSTSCKRRGVVLWVSIVLASAVFPFLTGCPTRPTPATGAVAPRRVPGQGPAAPAHEGRPYEVLARDSLLTIQVFRGGPLAKAGHNHVIASHALHGTLYVPADRARTTFEVSFPVAELTVDEASLRAKENEADFPPDVPDSAKEGTRKNMLGPALLDSEHYPEIVLRSLTLQAAPGMRPGMSPGMSNSDEWQARVEITVRDRPSTVVVPVHYGQHADEIVVSGDFSLKQTDLGLTPFSALLGALQVLDEMKIRFRIYFTPSSPNTASAL